MKIISLTALMILLQALASASADQPETVWHNAADLRIDGKGWPAKSQTYHRLPDQAKDKVRPAVWNLSRQSAGLVIHFDTSAPKLTLRWTLTSPNLSMPHMPATGVSGLDLYTQQGDAGKWTYLANARPHGKTNTATVDLKSSPGKTSRRYKLYLPLYNGIEKLEIGIPADTSFSQAAAPSAKPIVCYGTSIAQGACASRPGMAYTAMIERTLNTPLINLGFSGNGRMEPELADLLIELDPQLYVIDCLWNLTGTDDQTIQQRAANLIRTIRQKHPQTPILFVGQSSFTGPFPTPKTKALLKALEQAKQQGVTNLHFLPGRNLLGSDRDGTVDGCHPNDLGMRRHADVLIPAIKQILATPAGDTKN